MRRVLITGMSGTGKSAALAELRRRGFDVGDTDIGGSSWVSGELLHPANERSTR